jgi:hypothetical protein
MAGLPTGMGHGGRMMRAMEAMADTNHDGQISRAEFDAAAKARFDKADTNHDGKLTRAERHAAWGAIHTRHGKHSGMGHGGMEHGGKMGDDMGDMPPPPPLGE